MTKPFGDSAAQVRLLLDSTAEGIYGIDLHGNCTFANPSCFKMLGYASESDLLGKNMHDLIHHSYPDGKPMPVDTCSIFRAFKEGSGTHREDEVLWRADGTSFPVEYWSYPQIRDSKVIGAVVTFVDITQRKCMQDALKASEERYRLLAQNASDVIWTMDAQSRFMYVSPSIEKLRGYTPEEAIKQTLAETLMPESLAIVDSEMKRALAMLARGERFPDFRGEFEQPCKDGSTIWVEISTTGMYDSDGRFIGVLGVSRDVTERRKIQERLSYMAQHDSLTGLANRALFSDRLERAISLAKRERRSMALLFIDLDKFKPVNDTYGHAVGDLLLQEAAKRMKLCLRASDTIGRIGGDEFVVVLPGAISAEYALLVGEKIRTVLNAPYEIEGISLLVSTTVGVALFPYHGADAIQLTGNADAAMYDGKKDGGNVVRMFNPSLRR